MLARVLHILRLFLVNIVYQLLLILFIAVCHVHLHVTNLALWLQETNKTSLTPQLTGWQEKIKPIKPRDTVSFICNRVQQKKRKR